MPTGAIHLCVGKRVLEKLNINESMNYYIGTVSADSWRNSSSTKMGTHFLDCNDSIDYHYDVFYNKYFRCMDNVFVFGYLVHLITDKYWYGSNFITSNIYEDDYDDLKKLCSSLIEYYDIPKLFLPVNLNNPISELDSSGIIYTIDYLNGVDYVGGESFSFNIDLVKSSIEKTSDFVVSEISRLRELSGVKL
ncbi:MAG: hypothetical protein ACI31V_01025 [Bacilli bacterium]